MTSHLDSVENIEKMLRYPTETSKHAGSVGQAAMNKNRFSYTGSFVSESSDSLQQWMDVRIN